MEKSLALRNTAIAAQEGGRKRQVNIIVGIRAAGKSTFIAKKIIPPYKGNLIVVKHIINKDDPAFAFLPEKTSSNWRQGAKPGAFVQCKAVITQEEYLPFLNWVKAGNFKNGQLIIDDCTIFENRNVLSEQMVFLVTMCRHMGIDLTLVYHGLTKLPIEQFIFVDHFIIFNTTDKIVRKKDRIPQYELFEWAINQARYNYNQNDIRTKYSPVIIKMS